MIGSRGLPPMLAFLFDLAWASRVRLPLLIAAAFMVTNIHMRLEININFEMEEQIVMQDVGVGTSDGSADGSNNNDEEDEDDEDNDDEDDNDDDDDYYYDENGDYYCTDDELFFEEDESNDDIPDSHNCDITSNKTDELKITQDTNVENNSSISNQDDILEEHSNNPQNRLNNLES